MKFKKNKSDKIILSGIGLVILSSAIYAAVFVVDKKVFSDDCSDLEPVSEYALEEYNTRKERWTFDSKMPEEYAGVRYASFLGSIKLGSVKLGKTYTHGYLEGGLKCTSFIDSLYRKSGREMPTRRLNSIYGTQNFYNLDGVEDYFEYVEENDLQKEDIVIGYGNPGHIGIILDPKNKRNISTHHNDGIRIDENYNVYERVVKNENVEGGYELKKPRFLRYTGCKKN
jgi:hypothetical protein